MIKLITILSLFFILSCENTNDDSKELDLFTKKLIGTWFIDSAFYNGVIDYTIKGYKYKIYETKKIMFIYPKSDYSEGTWAFNIVDSIFLMKLPFGNFSIKVLFVDSKNLKWEYINQGNYIVEFMTKD